VMHWSLLGSVVVDVDTYQSFAAPLHRICMLRVSRPRRTIDEHSLGASGTPGGKRTPAIKQKRGVQTLAVRAVER
jgi:hypothetical protein